MGCGYRPDPLQSDGLPLAAQEEIRRHPRTDQPRVNCLVPIFTSRAMGQTLSGAGSSHCRTGERTGVCRNLEAFVRGGLNYRCDKGGPCKVHNADSLTAKGGSVGDDVRTAIRCNGTAVTPKGSRW